MSPRLLKSVVILGIAVERMVLHDVSPELIAKETINILTISKDARNMASTRATTIINSFRAVGYSCSVTVSLDCCESPLPFPSSWARVEDGLVISPVIQTDDRKFYGMDTMF